MSAAENTTPQPEWLSYLHPEEWDTFCEVLRLMTDAKIEALLGGGLGLSAYMPLRRRTKDLDFYVRPGDRDRTVALLDKAGFTDYHDQLPYDRSWIYRGIRGEVIVDIIWSFANHLTEVDDEWFIHSRSAPFDGFDLHVMPPEELIWAKLFVLQRDRSDWPDLLNLLYYTGPDLNWERLRARLGPNEPLLEGLLSVFNWLCPAHLLKNRDAKCEGDRVRLLDSRDWFLPQFAPTED
jgi:hypothetical protein